MSNKRFPLPLASVVDTAQRRPASLSQQTAMQNLSSKESLAKAEPRTLQDPNDGVRSTEAFRNAMVQRLAQKGITDNLVLQSMQAVPRHLFLDSALGTQAYIDASLPIGHQQTISQPYIVARMIEVMRNRQSMTRVLEVGTGCGYQAAVLSLLAEHVYSIERIRGLHELAKANLRPMRIANIRLHYGDGRLGLPDLAPFDGIILAAAGIEVPDLLLQQLRIGGRLVAPVGDKQQVLLMIERQSRNQWHRTVLEPCNFVPLHSGVV